MKDKRPENDKIQFSLPLNKRLLKYTFWVTLIIVVAYTVISNPQRITDVIGGVFSVLSPLIIGFCIAYVVNILMRPLERLWLWIWRNRENQSLVNKAKRPVCLTLSFLLVVGIVCAILFMVIPAFKETIVKFVGNVDKYAKTIEGWYVAVKEFFGQFEFDLPTLSLNKDKLTQIAGNTVGSITSIFSVVIDMVLGIIFAVYLLAQKEKLSEQTRRTVFAILKPKRAQRLVDVTNLANNAFTRFITGQLTEACVLGVLCFIGMWIFNMPYAVIISVLIGFMALIPIFGAFIGTGIGAFLILLESPSKVLWFVIFIIVLQQLEGNLIYPRVVGKSVGLPPVWVLASVTIGGGLFGIAGMLFSVPTCAVIYPMFRAFVNKRTLAKADDEDEDEE